MSAFVVLSSLCVCRAGAQPGPPALDQEPAAENDAYDRMISEGIRRFNDHKFERARAMFADAHAIRPSARTLRALGLSDVALEHYVRAQQELEAALVDERKPLTAAQREEVTDLLAWMRDNLAIVRLRYTPHHALAKIDQRPVTSGDLLLEPGLHEVQVTAPGFEAQQQRFQLILTDTPFELSIELTKQDALAGRSQSGGDGGVSRAWLWVGLPSLVATLAGAGFLTAGLVAISDAERPSGFDRVERFYERAERGRLYTTLGWTIGGVGLAGMITAAVIKLNDTPAGNESRFAYHIMPGHIAVTRSF